MSRLCKLAAVLLVALWLPATLHCRLGGLGLDALFACADQPAQTAHNDDNGCTDDGCQTIESGQFALAKSRIDPALLPALACICVHCYLHVTPPAMTGDIIAARQDKLLPLQRTWQFARRAALPARAPDALKV